MKAPKSIWNSTEQIMKLKVNNPIRIATQLGMKRKGFLCEEKNLGINVKKMKIDQKWHNQTSTPNTTVKTRKGIAKPLINIFKLKKSN